MTRLSPEARAIVEAGRRAAEPEEADRERVRRSLAARIGLGVAAAGAATAAGSAAAGSTKLTIAGALSSPLVKGLLVALGLAGAGIAYRAASGRSAHQNAAQPASSIAPVDSARPAAVMPPLASASSAAPMASSSAHTPGMVLSAASASSAPSESLEQEVARLRRAHEALRDGRPERAMTELDAGEQGDVLAEERAAMRVFTLCGMGKIEEAHLEAERFLARWPRSPQAPRVRAGCASADGGLP